MTKYIPSPVSSPSIHLELVVNEDFSRALELWLNGAASCSGLDYSCPPEKRKTYRETLRKENPYARRNN